MSDPLAYLTPPVGGGCLPSHTNMVVTTAMTLSPGNYCGTGGTPAIKLSGPNGLLVTFSPGTYVIDGGGLSHGRFTYSEYCFCDRNWGYLLLQEQRILQHQRFRNNS